MAFRSAACAAEDRQECDANIRELYSTLAEITPARTTAKWMTLCAGLDIPATPICALDDLPSHPQAKAVGLFQTMTHPSEGTLRFVRPTAKFARAPARVGLPAPLRGQHSREILHQAGSSDPEVDTLVLRGIVIEPAAIRNDNHGI